MLKAKRLIGFLGMSYQEVADYLDISKSGVEKKCNGTSKWKKTEIQSLLQKIKIDMNIEIDIDRVEY